MENSGIVEYKKDANKIEFESDLDVDSFCEIYGFKREDISIIEHANNEINLQNDNKISNNEKITRYSISANDENRELLTNNEIKFEEQNGILISESECSIEDPQVFGFNDVQNYNDNEVINKININSNNNNNDNVIKGEIIHKLLFSDIKFSENLSQPWSLNQYCTGKVDKKVKIESNTIFNHLSKNKSVNKNVRGIFTLCNMFSEYFNVNVDVSVASVIENGEILNYFNLEKDGDLMKYKKLDKNMVLYEVNNILFQYNSTGKDANIDLLFLNPNFNINYFEKYKKDFKKDFSIKDFLKKNTNKLLQINILEKNWNSDKDRSSIIKASLGEEKYFSFEANSDQFQYEEFNGHSALDFLGKILERKLENGYNEYLTNYDFLPGIICTTSLYNNKYLSYIPGNREFSITGNNDLIDVVSKSQFSVSGIKSLFKNYKQKEIAVSRILNLVPNKNNKDLFEKIVKCNRSFDLCIKLILSHLMQYGIADFQMHWIAAFYFYGNLKQNGKLLLLDSSGQLDNPLFLDDTKDVLYLGPDSLGKKQNGNNCSMASFLHILQFSDVLKNNHDYVVECVSNCDIKGLRSLLRQNLYTSNDETMQNLINLTFKDI